MNSSPMWSVIATAIGALTAICATFAVNLWSFSEKRRALRAAFRGEISSIVSILTKRGYVESLQNGIAHMKNTSKDSLTWFPARRSFVSVYEKNVDKVGMLGSTAEDLIIFYSQVFSILEDNDTLREISQGASHAGPPDDKKRIKRFIHFEEQLLSLVTDTLERGKKLVEIL